MGNLNRIYEIQFPVITLGIYSIIGNPLYFPNRGESLGIDFKTAQVGRFIASHPLIPLKESIRRELPEGFCEGFMLLRQSTRILWEKIELKRN